MGRFVLFLSLLIAAFPAFSQETDPSLDAWYRALEKADVAALESAMIAEDFSPFEYKIEDLGVTQNRAEFIDSMAEWVGAIAGGSISYKVTEFYEGGMTVLVCYRFTESEFLAQEDVGVYDTKITAVSQTSKGNSCANF